MANQERKAAIRVVCEEFAKQDRIEGVFAWDIEESRYGIAMTSAYSFETSLGLNVKPSIVISLYIGWNTTFSDVRLMFLGTHSQYHNRKYHLRKELHLQIIEEFERCCVALDTFYLFIEQVTPIKP